MNDAKVRKLVMSALFAALACVATMLLIIPLPGNGYANLGDMFIIVSGVTLGPVWGAMAGAVGASLADVLLGYAVYAPATFAIKWLVAASAFYVCRALVSWSRRQTLVPCAVSSITAELVMVTGYFIYELFLFGAKVAAADIIGNMTQGAVCAAAGAILLTVIHKSPVLKGLFKST